MDFWVWAVILFVAWALEALASAAKKRRAPPPEDQQGMPPRRPPLQHRPPPPGRLPSTSPLPPPTPQTVRLPSSLESDYELEEEPLLIEVPVRRSRDFESAEPLEGISAEVTRAEDVAKPLGPQHVRAREKYGPVRELVSPSKRASSRRVARLREAVIWMEILGPPRGLRPPES